MFNQLVVRNCLNLERHHKVINCPSTRTSLYLTTCNFSLEPLGGAVAPEEGGGGG